MAALHSPQPACLHHTPIRADPPKRRREEQKEEPNFLNRSSNALRRFFEGPSKYHAHNKPPARSRQAADRRETPELDLQSCLAISPMPPVYCGLPALRHHSVTLTHR